MIGVGDENSRRRKEERKNIHNDGGGVGSRIQKRERERERSFRIGEQATEQSEGESEARPSLSVDLTWLFLLHTLSQRQFQVQMTALRTGHLAQTQQAKRMSNDVLPEMEFNWNWNFREQNSTAFHLETRLNFISTVRSKGKRGGAVLCVRACVSDQATLCCFRSDTFPSKLHFLSLSLSRPRNAKASDARHTCSTFSQKLKFKFKSMSNSQLNSAHTLILTHTCSCSRHHPH